MLLGAGMLLRAQAALTRPEQPVQQSSMQPQRVQHVEMNSHERKGFAQTLRHILPKRGAPLASHHVRRGEGAGT
jgi:hypothetical protein